MPNVILKLQRWLRKQFVKPIVDALIVSLRKDQDTWLWSDYDYSSDCYIVHVSKRFYIQVGSDGYARVCGDDGRTAIEMTGFERYVLGKAAQSWLTNYDKRMVSFMMECAKGAGLKPLTQ